MSAYQRVYVEGKEDILTLEKIFPTMKGVLLDGNGKLGVNKKVSREGGVCGLIDRDFASEEEVVASHGSGSRVRILPRYCLESYLLEPNYLFELAKQYNVYENEEWDSTEAIQTLILAKGQALSYYTAANELLDRMSKQMSYRQLHKHCKVPIIAQDEVLGRLQERFSKLPTREDLATLLTEWETKSAQIRTACATLEGVHCLINGKVLLKKVIFSAFKEVDPARFATYEEEEFIEELASIAEEDPPADLVTIFRDFGIV